VVRGVREWRSSLVTPPYTLHLPAAINAQPTVTTAFVRVCGHKDLLTQIFDKFREGDLVHPHVLEPAKRVGNSAKCWYTGVIHPIQRASRVTVPSQQRLRAVGSQPRMWDHLDIDMGKPRVQHWDVPSDLLDKMDAVFHNISSAHLARKVKGYILQNLSLPFSQLERIKVPKLPPIFFQAMVKDAPDTYK